MVLRKISASYCRAGGEDLADAEAGKQEDSRDESATKLTSIDILAQLSTTSYTTASLERES